MTDFIDRIHHFRDNADDTFATPHGPVRHIGNQRLAVSNYSGTILEIAGLAETLELSPIPKLHRDVVPDLTSFSSDGTGTRMTGIVYSRENRHAAQMLLTETTGIWQALAAPQPVRDGAPEAQAVLAGFIGGNVFSFHVLPRFARMTPETLVFSKFDANGTLLESKALMTAAQRPRRAFGGPDLVWTMQHTAERSIAYIWDMFWLIEPQGVRELPLPEGMSTAPAALSAGEDDKVLMFCPADATQEAAICDLDLITWTCARQPISALLRKDKSSGSPWMPAEPEIIQLRDGWVLLNLHDGSGLNRTACWLCDRSTDRTWPIQIAAFGTEVPLNFIYSTSEDKVIVSTSETIFVSKALSAIISALEKVPRLATPVLQAI